MKNTFTIILALFAAFAYGQKTYQTPLQLNNDNRVEFSEVINVDGISKDELYNRAKEWFASTYRSATDVIQVDNK